MSDQLYESALQILTTDGSEGFKNVLVKILNEVMKYERSAVLNAQPYERTEKREGHANGFKNKSMRTTLGKLDFDIPQVRGDVEFYPTGLEKGLRSERALKSAMAEMYINGVSTRKVTRVFEKMCGVSVTSDEVSRATKLLDEEFSLWRNRALGKISHLIIDARYEKVREGRVVVDKALLVAVGVTPEGKRSVLGLSVSSNEGEVHWRTFFESLQKRGMHGLESITSDAHTGIRAARRSVFPSVPWQRCQFHLQQNAQAYVPRVSMREEVARDIRIILNAPDLEEAERYLAQAVEKYSISAPRLSEWMEENIPEGLTVFSLPQCRRKKLRTSNGIERLNREIKKRTKVVSIFPNDASLERLATAILIEISEEWETGRKYMKMNLEN
ncbi:MAG: IS256 family transposase [Candidatus Brocadiaceae bacterium]|nr:IS256 family transposase [Candidatus Brocadiaceae bacterium]